MTNGLRNYFIEWWTIIARPIYFYAKLKEEKWQEKSLTFLLITAWILAAAAALAIFVLQFVPIGATLVEGITGIKFLIILPVLITLAAVFFAMTLLIVGGVFVFGFGAMFYALSFAFYYLFSLWGEKGSKNSTLQSIFYSSAILLAGLFPILFALLTKYNFLDFSLFRVGFNLAYGFILLYVYGLWAVAVRKIYHVPKWKAFAGALAPVIILLIFGFIFDKIAINRLESWITPLK